MHTLSRTTERELAVATLLLKDDSHNGLFPVLLHVSVLGYLWLGLRLFSNIFLSINYAVNTFVFFFREPLRSSDTNDSDVLDMYCIYVISLAAPGFTVSFGLTLLKCKGVRFEHFSAREAAHLKIQGKGKCTPRGVCPMTALIDAVVSTPP